MSTPRSGTTRAIIALTVLLLLSLFLLAGLVADTERFDRYRWWLFGSNVLLAGVFFVLIVINCVSLVRKRLRKEAGSRLTTKLTIRLVLLVLAPAAALYTFSAWLVTKSVDSWFDVKIEAALGDALDLSRHSLDTQLEQYRRMIDPVVSELNDTPEELSAYVLPSLLEQSGAGEMSIISNNRNIVASVSTGEAGLLPNLPDAEALGETSQGRPYLGVDYITDSGLFARLVFPLNQTGMEAENRLLQVLYPMSERVNTLAANVQSAYREYDRLFYLRDSLQSMLVVILTLVLLSGVLYAVWLAFYSSASLMRPIAMLAGATRDVGSGKLDIKLDASSKDDLGELVGLFNQMTARLAQARDLNETSQRLIENKSAHLHTVLEGISSGVLSLDSEFVLQTANPAAEKILNIRFSGLLGRPLCPNADNPALRDLCDRLLSLIHSGRSEWKQEFGLFVGDEYKTLTFHVATIPNGSYVVVFNDVTETVQASRETAWEEVARRMAHEIKNPLTPIQLAAERLRNKLAEKLSGTSAEFLKRCTYTIVDQVQSMQNMVDEFSQYAHSFPSKLTPLEINGIVRDICELYYPVNFTLELDLDPENPPIAGDGARLRQLLHNLLKNAGEALAGKPDGRVNITTRVRHAPFVSVEISVSDNGPGFDKHLMERIFEPYVSSKLKGQGLGLAIVKKITEEHNGKIKVANLAQGGALVTVTLPYFNIDPMSKAAAGSAA